VLSVGIGAAQADAARTVEKTCPRNAKLRHTRAKASQPFTTHVICSTIQGIMERPGGFRLGALGAVHNSGGLDIGYQYEPVTLTCGTTEGRL
jgi:hypothetical protein